MLTEMPKSVLSILIIGCFLYLPKILQSIVAQAKKLGKSVYLFSVDPAGEKVVHVNFVSESARNRGLEARLWASKVSEIIGGKVRLNLFLHVMTSNFNTILKAGGKEDSAQGVGINVGAVQEAIKVAQDNF